MNRIILFVCLLILSPSVCFSGGDLYVATTGTNNGSCGAIGSPCRTIQYTITNRITDANGGWNIILRGGTYQEHDIYIAPTKTGTSGAWNTLRSYAGEWAIIDGQRANTGPNTYATLKNWDGNECTSGTFAQYWILERFELTGGGHSSGTVIEGAGLWWVKGPFTMRYTYIHDNLTVNGDENSAGISGTAWQGNTIEYNYFYNNGSEAHEQLNSTAGPGPISCSEYYAYDQNWEIRDNTIRYNYIVGSGDDTGIRTKGYTTLTSTRNGSDTSRRTYGDKLHHNIVKGVNVSIHYQQDGVQIYNNITDQTGQPKSTGYNDGHPIKTRRWNSTERDVLWPVVYNNTCFDASEGIVHFHQNDSGGAYYWNYNNILDQATGITLADIVYGCSNGSGRYCPDYSTSTLDITNVNIDRNYVYRGPSTSYVLAGDQAWPTGAYTFAQWETLKSANLYKQAYNAGNLLFQGTSGADKYRVRSAHTVEGSTTIANGGIGGSHPYLAGVTFPSYIGAANPSDDSWVAGVLALNSTYFTSAINGSTPSWIEGGGGDTTPPTVTISTTDPSSITEDSLTATGTASDAVGVSSCKWRLSSAPDGSNGTSCTGTTSWSCSASGFSRGANTLYVGCGDAAGNWGSDSMVVNYLPVIQGVSGLGISFR